MKQGDRFLKILMLVIAAVVLSYFGYAAVRYFADPVASVTALEYETDIGANVTGYVVRDELLLTADDPILVPTRNEGERVGSGQTVAVAYRSADAQQRQAEMTDLQQQIAILSAACDESLSPTAVDGEIRALLVEYARRSVLRQNTADSELSADLKGRVLRGQAEGEDLNLLRSSLSALREQLSALTSESGLNSRAVSVPQPGYFSGTADGYETVLTPEVIDTMTAADFFALSPAPVAQQVYGTLVTSEEWYFITVIDDAMAAELHIDDRLLLSFTRDTYQEIPMRVRRIGPGEEGGHLLVLSGDSYVQDVTMLREQSCILKLRSYSGLRVPKSAVHIDEDGTAGVFILEGAAARWKPIEILYAVSDSYVVTLDQTSTDNLWPGDEILLGDSLYQGKVVIKQ